MRRRVGWLVPAVFLGLGVSTGWAGARRTDTTRAAPAPASWETAVVATRDVSATVLATGVIRPRVGAQVAVGSRASGVLEKLHVTVGDRVAAGQLLAELDAVEYETMVERAEAQRANAAAEHSFAETEFARVRALAERNATSAAELAAAQRTLETARARERETRATVAAARVQLAYTSIRAPINGVVASVSTQEGETVAASFAAPTFVTIVDLSRLEVWAYIDETDIGRVRVGQRARFTVDTYTDEAFEGRVIAIRPGAEIRDNVVNYIALIAFTQPPGKLLRPEMTTTVNVMLDGRKDVLSVPNAALRRDSGGTFVLAPDGERLDRRAVKVGLRGADFTEVLSGLRAGERIVLGATGVCEAEKEAAK